MNELRRRIFEARRLETLLGCLALVSCISCGAVTYAPYAPKDQDAMAPQGESEPAVRAPENPLDTPSVVEVVCSPQMTPIVETEEVRRCKEDVDCQVVCE